MRRLLLSLTALLLVAPAAHAADDPFDYLEIRSVGKPASVLTADPGGLVTLRPGNGAPGQQWRIFPADTDPYVTVLVKPAVDCLTGYEPQDVRMLRCIGAQSQTWAKRVRPEGSFALENSVHPDTCLTAMRPAARVELTPCNGTPDQLWIAKPVNR
ncbi:RICIN domain-containing protein [Actinosynnema sp. NPDC050436]|uniref:RICIN domain-containing protein n=1 Tax=Actinosynnema sp. NPDC050436 TaxID=3155659 RepID=UPI0033F27B7D